MKASTVKEVLIAAKWILENVGWCQGAYYKDKNGLKTSVFAIKSGDSLDCCCLVGACNLVDTDFYLSHCAVQSLGIVVGNQHVPTWNDSKGRTKEEVIAAINTAIEKENAYV